MSKKDRMLNHISSNVKWFLSTIDSNTEVIPYYNMSNEVFLRAKEYLVTGYVDFNDVVCLVSTSVLAPGKSGILFTIDAMYCKSWGLLTTKYYNYYFGYEYATFDSHNDFYENRMKELMKDLNDIRVEEDESEQLTQKINDIIDIGKKVGTVALGGMTLLDILSSIGDNEVSQNNDKIAQEIAKLEDSNNKETANAITIYKEFIPLIDQFANICEKAGEEGDDISEETYYAMILSLEDILLALYKQTVENVDISPEDDEEYTRYGNWLRFWTLMFYDGEQFREAYSLELLEEMPECWRAIVELMDDILEDEWEDSFSGTIYKFAETVVNNSTEILELMSDSDWDDDFFESMSEMVEANNQAVKSLENVLDRATDYLNDLLPDVEE